MMPLLGLFVLGLGSVGVPASGDVPAEVLPDAGVQVAATSRGGGGGGGGGSATSRGGGGGGGGGDYAASAA